MKNQQIAKKIKQWREDPVLFVRECFGADPDPWQKDALEAFTGNNRIAMKASKGVGKSTLLAWCCWNFLATRPNPKIAATAITADNLSDCLWSEMALWMNRSEFLKSQFTWTKTRIMATHAPETWWMSARTWSKGADSSQQANTLAGLHADYLMFVLDESGGIPDAVMAAAEGGLSTGVETKIIQAGNPTHLQGPLYRACTKERDLWHVIEITSDPDSPKRSPRVSKQWAKEQIKKYGKDNPWVLVNVFGKFPPTSMNALIGPDACEAAVKRYIPEDQYASAQKRLGIDCARFGDDSTIIFPRQGLRAFNPVELRGADTMSIAARVLVGKQKWGSEMEFVDGTGGFGAGVVDSLRQAGASPLEIHFSSAADDPRYFNKRSEMYFRMAEWIKSGAIPNIPELIADLTTPTYTFQNGKLRIEEKDQIKQRLGRSPDYSDALCLSFALVEMPSGQASQHFQQAGLGGRVSIEYDPFSGGRADGN